MLGLYIAIGIIYALLGTFENSILWHDLFSSKKLVIRREFFVIALAVLDILACTMLAHVASFQRSI